MRALVHEGEQREVVEPVAGLRDGQAGQQAAEAGVPAGNVHDGESAPEGASRTSETRVGLLARPLISVAGRLTRASQDPDAPTSTPALALTPAPDYGRSSLMRRLSMASLLGVRDRWVVRVAVLVTVLALAIPAGASAATSAARAAPVVPPFGKLYDRLSVAWWQYTLAQPAATNPLVDPTGANCRAGQSGPMFSWPGPPAPGRSRAISAPCPSAGCCSSRCSTRSTSTRPATASTPRSWSTRTS